MPVPVFKILLVGDPNVGKSSLIRRILLDEFDENYNTTIGVDLSAAVIQISPENSVILTLVDLGGQKDFTDLRTHYYKDAHYAILVYDISSRESFNALSDWYEGMNMAMNRETDSQPNGILLGNKADMIDSRQVSSEEGLTYAKELGWDFVETSAKTGQNVEDTFNQVAKFLYEQNQ